ncbi:UDP-glycosyltransferase 71D1-like [Bidens hawaiensis]|uniref:UDP-glycosyltransferase 71D1-like n=1 Tax=Bidens hawaiensis TaxID=980011 RepID=UPI00404B746E
MGSYWSHLQTTMKKQELVFIPLAASSHLTGSIQFAKSLLDQNENLSITVLIILLPPQKDLDPYTKSVVSSNNHIKFIIIPSAITNHLPQPFSSSISVEMFVHRVFESHKPQVEHAIMDLVSDDSTQIVGFVLDMFSSCMIDVANKFMVPSYMFCSFSTAFLGFLLHLPDHHNRVGVNFHPSDSESVIPSYQNHVPANVLPGAVFDKSGGGYESYV